MSLKPYLYRAKYYETDQMAIVHHSNYIRWFEDARIDWMRQIGLDFREIEQRGIVVPVVSVSCQYKSMTHFNEDVAIYATLTQFNGIRFAFSYEVRDVATGALRATGTSEHCFLKGERIVNLKRVEPEIYRLFEPYVAKNQ
ncbi:MAG: acyl-CoA thioesterase [Oscillospiraceae bacterium]|nr:acyl-CoA thioesterase [Oscillospiraceae bacterium]